MAIKEKTGVVVSDKMENTCIVAVSDRIVHKGIKKLLHGQNVTLYTTANSMLQLVTKSEFVKLNHLVKRKIGFWLMF